VQGRVVWAQFMRVESVIGSLAGKQVCMLSLPNDLAFVDDDNLVGVLYGCQTVGNDDGCAPGGIVRPQAANPF
jgi:hypothetical protein